MQITSHIIFDKECKFKSEIYSVIKNVLASYPDIGFNEDNIEIILIKSQHERFLVKFNLQFDEVISEKDNLVVESIFSALSTLTPKSQNVGIFKFQDDNQLTLNKSFYEKVYIIEMQIREVLFYIFWYKYGKERIYDFLSRFGDKYNIEKGKDYTKTFDHKLFYVMFSSYKELTKFQNLNTFDIPSNQKDKDIKYLFDKIKKINSIEELILELRSLWIDNDKHITLLAGISEYLDSIEKLRNAIAHNRHIEQNIVDNAIPSIEKIKTIIDEFWKNETDEISLFDLSIKEALVYWFFCNYEDPANGVPYDSAEGGYLFINGGPYEALDILFEEFPDIDNDILDDVVNIIENQGDSWVRIGDY